MRKLFIPLLAALALVGCSQSDEPGNKGQGSGDYSYVAVNIVQPGNAGSRATEASEGFEYGTDDENYAQEGLFFIFSADGNTMVGDAQRIALAATGDTGNTPEVEKIYSAVLVIDGVKDKPAADLQVVCVLNAPDGIETGVSTITGLKEKIANYGAATKGHFIMSNSVYKDGGTEVLGARITDANLKQSSSEALNNPVRVYVERVVARIDVTEPGEAFVYYDQEPLIDGVKKTLYINIKGLEIANIATTSYLFKNITGIDYAWAWDASNKRSYWETCPANLAYSNKSYNAINNNTPNATSGLVPVFDFANATLKEYVQPNTTSQKTSVLVTAQLTEDKAGQIPFSFLYLKGGYYTPNGAGALLAQYLATTSHFYYKKAASGAGTTYSQLPASAFEWKNRKDFDGVTNLTNTEKNAISALEDYEVIGRLKTSGEGAIAASEIYVKNGDNFTPITNISQVNEALLGYVAEYWKDGMCYYFMEIDQTPVATANGFTQPDPANPTKFYGVVRNHIYRLSLKSIKGLGTPVFDPTDEIVPDRREDDDLWYLAAEIEVLAWKLATQDVNFDM